MPVRRRPGASYDLEEIRPGLFIVHNPALRSLLRGEGQLEGDRFLLTSPRRAGLLARLQARTFVVQTLDALLAALPALPAPLPSGPPLLHSLASAERFSRFSAPPPGWTPLEPEADSNPLAVLLCPGWVVRRRRGRGAADYFLVGVTPGNQLRLTPLDADQALLQGYGQLATGGPPVVRLLPFAQGYLLPDLPLPTTHVALLRRLAQKTKEGWQISAASTSLVQQLLSRLHLILTS